MPRLRKNTVITAKLESAEGTFTAPDDATDTLFLVQDVSFKPEPTIIERNFIGPSFARKGPSIVTIKLARITFRTEIMGSGTAGTEPKWARFLKCCGLKSTNVPATSDTYDPVVPSSLAYDATGLNGNTTLSIEVHEDGVRKAARGCRGTFRITAEAGGLCYIDWEFLGIFQDVADVTLPTLSTGFDNQVPPIFESALLTFHGLTGSNILVRTATIDLGNNLVPRFDANSASGIKSIIITDRETTGTLDPEQATKAEWSTSEATERLMAGTTGAFTFTVGTAPGNRLVFSAPAALAQITDVTEGDRDELLTNTLNFMFGVAMNEGTGQNIQFLLN